MAQRTLAGGIAETLRGLGIDPDSLPEPVEAIEPGDYRDADGMLVCGECGQPKESVYIADDGHEVRLPIVHPHEIERTNTRADVLRRECFRSFEGYAGAVFAECDAPVKSVFMAWCDQFREFGLSKGQGFIIYGGRGVGKTYLASCVCNRLIESGYRCRLTSLRAAIDDRQAVVSELEKMDLVVIDDLGTERDTPYGLETVYDVVNRLYSKRVPMVITTNLTRSQIADPPRGISRAMDRIKERCQPLEYAGANRRQGAML